MGEKLQFGLEYRIEMFVVKDSRKNLEIRKFKKKKEIIAKNRHETSQAFNQFQTANFDWNCYFQLIRKNHQNNLAIFCLKIANENFILFFLRFFINQIETI